MQLRLRQILKCINIMDDEHYTAFQSNSYFIENYLYFMNEVFFIKYPPHFIFMKCQKHFGKHLIRNCVVVVY